MQVAKPAHHPADFFPALLRDCKVPAEYHESLGKWEITPPTKEYARCIAGLGAKRMEIVKEDNTLDMEIVEKIFTDMGRPVPEGTSELANIDVDTDAFAEKFFAWHKQIMGGAKRARA